MTKKSDFCDILRITNLKTKRKFIYIYYSARCCKGRVE